MSGNRLNSKKTAAKEVLPEMVGQASSCLMALEPRIMYDVAGAISIADSVDGEMHDSVAPCEGAENAIHDVAAVVDLFSGYLPPAIQPKELIFVDGGIDDYQQFVDGAVDDAVVIVLDPGEDGVTRISEELARYHDLDAIHIVSHGGPGSLQFGDSTLSLANLTEKSVQLQGWGNALASGGDILLYGCDVAAGEDGIAFVEQLAGLTGADVAASVDRTGAVELGGDWQLEYSYGTVASVVPLSWQSYASVLGTVEFIDSGQDFNIGQTEGGALGDLDGDGDLDVFLVNTQSPDKVFFNDGSGVFTDSGQALGGSSDFGQEVALGDLDADGDLDAYVVIAGASDKIYWNNGSGVFSDSGQSLSTASARGITLGDLDGDGDLDAFIANYGGNQVYWNTSVNSGTFTNSGQSLGTGSSQDVDLADLDGDGDLDAFVANWGSEANEVWLNNGSGVYSLNQSLGSSVSMGVSLGDVDGDTDIDAFVANLDGQPDKVWLNDGSGSFTDSGQNLGSTASNGVKLEDVDQDGDLDAFVVGGYLWFNDGAGTYTASGLYSGGQEVIFGDLNGDGDNDAFLAIRWGNKVLYNNAVPVLSVGGGPVNYFENDAGLAVIADPGSVGIIDNDDASVAGAQIQIVGNYVEGEDVLEFVNTGSISGFWNAATATLTLSGVDTNAAYNAALTSVTFKSLSDNPSVDNRTISYSVSDGYSESTPVTSTVTVTAVNDAPELFVSADPVVKTVVIGEEEPLGKLVGEILEGNVFDVDSSPLYGVAFTGADNSNGNWQYSLDGGSVWVNFDSLSDNNATLLAADSLTRVRFLPDVIGFTGTTSFSFRAWDQTDSLPNGTTNVDVSANGGITAYSVASQDVLVEFVEPVDGVALPLTDESLELASVLTATGGLSEPLVTDDVIDPDSSGLLSEGLDEYLEADNVSDFDVPLEPVVDDDPVGEESPDESVVEGEETTDESAEDDVSEEELSEEEGEEGEEGEEEAQEEAAPEAAALAEGEGEVVVEGQAQVQTPDGRQTTSQQLAKEKGIVEAEQAEILKIFEEVFDLLQCD